MGPKIFAKIGPFKLKNCQEPYFCIRNPKKIVPRRSVIWVIFTDIDS
jgi:hypothetical protein